MEIYCIILGEHLISYISFLHNQWLQRIFFFSWSQMWRQYFMPIFHDVADLNAYKELVEGNGIKTL